MTVRELCQIQGEKEMALVSYKCPNCGGSVVFDPKKQKFCCEFCMSEFTEEEMKAAALSSTETSGVQDGSDTSGTAGTEAQAESGVNAKAGTETGADQISDMAQSGRAGSTDQKEDALVYICPNCGAEVVTDATTAATFCYYCHNPVVLSGKLSGEFLPDYVIPFAMDKKQATGIFLDWIKKKKYIPDDFFSKSQIEKFSGVYFPYLMYSCKVDGKIQAEGEKQRTWVAGNIRYTEHKKYRMERAGELDVRNVTRNALKKNNSALVEGVLPFDMEKLKSFDMGYLSGFQAEKRDMEKEALTPEVEQEVKQYTVEQLKNDVMGQYSAVRVDQSDTNIRDAKWQYALLPVWILTYRDKARKDELYYFAMNGQTGKICGKLPVAKGKLVKLFLEIFVPVAAILMIGGWFL